MRGMRFGRRPMLCILRGSWYYARYRSCRLLAAFVDIDDD